MIKKKKKRKKAWRLLESICLYISPNFYHISGLFALVQSLNVKPVQIDFRLHFIIIASRPALHARIPRVGFDVVVTNLNS